MGYKEERKVLLTHDRSISAHHLRAPINLPLDLLDKAAHLIRGHIDLARRKTAHQAELTRHALDPMRAVDVLDKRNLVACRAALATDDGAVREEVFPDAEPALAVFGFDGRAVGHPVAVPAP
jgi:hypothetical protein